MTLHSTAGLSSLAKLAVNVSNLLRPPPPVMVLHFQDVPERPVEVVRYVSYLLVQLLEGVASYSPGLPKSTSNLWLHSGQVVATLLLPFSLMRR